MRGDSTNFFSFDIRFLLWLCLFFLVFFVLTLPDYGITWDSAAAEFYVGDKYLHFFSSFDKAYLDLSLRNIPIYSDPKHPDFSQFAEYVGRRPHHIWSFGPLVSSMTKSIFFTQLRLFDPIDAHHLSIALFILPLIWALYYFVTREAGRAAAVVSVIALLIMPRFWADLHNNIKDVPATALFALSVTGYFSGFKAGNLKLIALATIVWGFGLATKANLLLVPVVVFFPLVAVWHGRGWAFSARIASAVVLAPIIACTVGILVWPYLLFGPPGALGEYVRYLAKAGSIGPDEWQLLPLIKVVTTTPLTILVPAIAGIFFATMRSLHDNDRRPFCLLVILWLFIPILRVSLPGAYHIDGIRHFLEFTVPLAVLCGLVGSSRVDLQACKLEYSIVSPK